MSSEEVQSSEPMKEIIAKEVETNEITKENVKPVKTIKKAATKKTAERTAPNHPTYTIMIVDALQELGTKNGVSKIAISKHMAISYKIDIVKAKKYINHALRTLVEKGTVTTKSAGLHGSFKLKENKEKKKEQEKKKVVKDSSKKTVEKKKTKEVKRLKSPSSDKAKPATKAKKVTKSNSKTKVTSSTDKKKAVAPKKKIASSKQKVAIAAKSKVRASIKNKKTTRSTKTAAKATPKKATKAKK
ncbi:hypothetical protein SNEBB_004715 [Seison nebaliae]|nr:hypothetical protein SNEBB_004715 [Seison nebaliae]